MKPRCAIHDLALNPEGQCVLCRRASLRPGSSLAPSGSEPAGRVARASGSPPWLMASVLAALVGGGLAWLALRKDGFSQNTAAPTSSYPTQTESLASATSTPAESPPAPVESVLEGALVTKNRSGRSGAYFIPNGSYLPLLVALHGSGGGGAGLTAELRELAGRRKFAIVAPDSGFIAEAGTYTWYVAKERGDSSQDSAHIEQCIQEVLALGKGRITPTGWLVLGHSGGASSAPYLATHDARFAAFAVLHGGAFPNAFGPLRPRGWFSTGSSDPARPPSHVSEQAQAAARVLGATLVHHHVFQGGHGLLPDEIEAVIEFWLGSAR